MSYYIHSVPGRLRVKTPLVKGNQVKARDVEGLLHCCQGVDKASANPLTGSIVVNYDSTAVNGRSIINILEDNGYFKSDKALTNDQYIHGAASKAGHLVWNAVFGSFVGMALEGTPLSFLSVLV
ncbi:MAG: HMA2 domain-containing protein [Thermodesulfobacteriota bacterium]